MTQKITPPSFIEGWERIPGATSFEINAEAKARNYGNKKEVTSKPDAEGNVLLYGNEKKLEKFNLRKIADELFGKEISGVQMETKASVILQEGEQIINQDLTIQQLKSQTMETKNTAKPVKKATTKTSPKNPPSLGHKKKAPSKAPTPQKAQSTKESPKVAKTPMQSPKTGDSKDVLVAKIKENAEKLKTGIIDEAKLKSKKAEIEKIMTADTFGHEKIYRLHKDGFSQPEITKITGKRKEVVQRDIWLYTTGKKKLK